MRMLLVGVLLVAACGKNPAILANPPPPCHVGPCPRSDENPCGLHAGCTPGRCDVVRDNGDENCFDPATGVTTSSFCDPSTGEFHGGTTCPGRPEYPDAGPDAMTCNVGPCPRSPENPCGLDPGCYAGECDVINGSGDETCEIDGGLYASFCDVSSGTFHGGAPCPPQPPPPHDAGP